MAVRSSLPGTGGLAPRRGLPQSLTTTLALVLVLLFLSAAPASAQVGTLIDTSKLPACAANCASGSYLLQAQGGCVPPAAAASNQATYQSCFCQSAFLTTFKTSVFDVCNNGCSTDDLGKIQAWYIGLCASGAPVVTPGGAKAAAGTSTTAAAGAATATTLSTKASSGAAGVEMVTATTAVSSGSTAAAAGGTSYVDPSNRSWISTHYQWLIMVIVLLLAALAAIFGGLWWKRRQRAKRYALHRDSAIVATEAADALRSSHPAAPSMSQAHYGAAGYTDDADAIAPIGPGVAAALAQGKGKEDSVARVRDMGTRADSSLSVPTSVESGGVGAPPPPSGETRKSRLMSKLR